MLPRRRPPLTAHYTRVLYELAEIRLFLVLVWVTALLCAATVVLYKLAARRNPDMAPKNAIVTT